MSSSSRCVACIRPTWEVEEMYQYPGREDIHICKGCADGLEVVV